MFGTQFQYIIFLFEIIFYTYAQYVPPKAFVRVFKPAGLRLSIPNEEGISLVAYHAKFNEEFIGLEPGTIARDIVNEKNGYWTYEDKTTVLKKGDFIYYWIHVIYNGLGYNLINQKYQVDEFHSHSNETKVEPPTVKPLKPIGIHISIADEEGISLVAFHVKFNEEFNGLEAGSIARDIIKPVNGRWTYEDTTTQLKKNDVIYFWLHIIYNKLGYNLLDQKHVVSDFYYNNGSKVETGCSIFDDKSSFIH